TETWTSLPDAPAGIAALERSDAALLGDGRLLAAAGTTRTVLLTLPTAVRAPASADLGTGYVGARGPAQTVSVTNTGDLPLLVDGVSLAGDAAADFAIADDTCSVAPVAPGATCTVGVRFAP